MRSAVTAMSVAVRDCLTDVEPGGLVLVACSGGPDSLALAAVAARVALPRRLRVGAVVVDHGWTPAATRAGRRAAVQLKELGLDPIELVEVDAQGDGGPEGSARSARYAALEQVAGATRAVAVLLGHTLDDQAETVLLGLGRGAGARSLAGMPAVRGIYRRPLLGLRRTVTEQACRELELRAWQDPANVDPRYARVRVRNLAGELAAALGPGIAEALARTAELLREDADALDAQAATLLAAIMEPSPIMEPAIMEVRPIMEIPAPPLLAAPVAVRRRALLGAARAAGCPAGALGRRHALALDALLSAKSGARADLPGGITASRGTGGVTFTGPHKPGHH